jgi:hypothetical protein
MVKLEAAPFAYVKEAVTIPTYHLLAKIHAHLLVLKTPTAVDIDTVCS